MNCMIRSYRRYVCIATLALTGCTTITTSPPVKLDASLRQPCAPLQVPADGTGAAMFTWSRQTVKDYNECADRHARTVEAWPK
jgi:hypothetical protein